MIDFKEPEEKKISDEFKKKGYLILKSDNSESLKYLRDKIILAVEKVCKIKKKKNNPKDNFLNNFHKNIKQSQLNDLRLKIINNINQDKKFKLNYFLSSKKILNNIVGNELSMQTRINLSIQTPKDQGSLLPLHSDIWSGDSPFEVVIWIPLVNCYNSKSMYILPPSEYKKVEKNFSKYSGKSSNEFFNKIKSKVKWLKVDYGQILIFNQGLPHGNIVNKENETRWSMNCRFKSVFSPYGDKKLGEFFEPITLKAASEIGISYKYPKSK